jgi:hypothetical protein
MGNHFAIILLTLWLKLVFFNYKAVALTISELCSEGNGTLRVVHGTGHNFFALDVNGTGRHHIRKGIITELRSRMGITVSVERLADDVILNIPILPHLEDDIEVTLAVIIIKM